MMIDLLADLLNDPLVTRAGWTLMHFIWQGVLVALLLAAALRVMQHAAPQARYAAGLVALLAMAALPVLTWTLLPASAPPVTETVSQEAVLSAASPERAMLVALGTPPTTMKPAGGVSWIERTEARLAAVLPYAVLGWLAGVLAFSVRLLGGIAHVGRLRRRDAQPVEEQWRRRFATLARRMGVRRRVRLLASSRAEGPLALGGCRPVVLVPGSLLTGLPPEQVEAILAHELAHLRRWDYEVNLLQSALEVVLFYHPAVWWVSRRVRQAREHCCDDRAAEASRSRLTYARALTALEALRGPALAPGASGGSLIARIRRLTGQPTPRRPRPRQVGVIGALVALAVGAGVLAACASTSRSPDAERPTRTAAAPVDTSAALVIADTSLAVDDGVRIVFPGDTLTLAWMDSVRSITGTLLPLEDPVRSIEGTVLEGTVLEGTVLEGTVLDGTVLWVDTLDQLRNRSPFVLDEDTIRAYFFDKGNVEPFDSVLRYYDMASDTTEVRALRERMRVLYGKIRQERQRILRQWREHLQEQQRNQQQKMEVFQQRMEVFQQRHREAAQELKREMRQQLQERMRKMQQERREYIAELRRQARERVEEAQELQRRMQQHLRDRRDETRTDALREAAEALVEQAAALREELKAVAGDTTWALEKRRFLREQIRLLKQQARRLRALAAEQMDG